MVNEQLIPNIVVSELTGQHVFPYFTGTTFAQGTYETVSPTDTLTMHKRNRQMAATAMEVHVKAIRAKQAQ